MAAVIAVVALVRRWQEATAGSTTGPPRTVMVFWTAAGVLLAAGALLMVQPRRGPAARRTGQALAAAAAVLGVSVAAQYAVGWAGDAIVRGGGWWAHRSSPASGIGLALVGGALLGYGARRRGVRRWADPAAIAALTVGVTGLVGHAYGASLFYGLNEWGGMAVSTSTAIALLAIGALFAHPERGVAAVALSDSTGGRVVRRLMPVAVLAPLLLGWIALRGYQAGFVDAPFAVAALVVTLIVILAVFAVRQAMSLHAFDAERERLLVRERQAHDRVTTILESITDAFFAVDRDWRFTYVNREAERLLQRPREQLLGLSLWEEFTPAVGSPFEREYNRAVAEQATVHFEAFYPPFDSWYEVSAYPTHDGLSVYFSNITDRVRAQEALRASEERYRLLVDMIPQHVWTTDAGGYHGYFSRRWYEFTGATPDETRGDGWLRFLHPDDVERTKARWRASRESGEPYSVEYRFRGADGRYHWFLGQAMPRRDEAGAVAGWFGTLTDISQRKRLDEERELLLQRERESRAEAERRREELERVTESRTRLMRGFSHDVKNPLGAADGYAQLMEEGIFGALSDRQLDSVRHIRRSIATSLRLIHDLLELARAEAGQIEIVRVETDVCVAARDVVDDFRAQAMSAGLELRARAPEGLRADTDPVRLRQILANLLSNAVKYAPGGQVTIDAEMLRNDGQRAGEWITVRVADTGPGIPEEKRDLIFQEFTRLDPEAREGAGVGLAISRRIARLMGADLTVDSEVGRGSTFTLWLPPAATDRPTSID